MQLLLPQRDDRGFDEDVPNYRPSAHLYPTPAIDRLLSWTHAPHSSNVTRTLPNVSEDARSDDDDDGEYSGAFHHPVIGCILAFFSLFTVAGNVLVIVAVVRERYLRSTVTNYFIVSLGLADLIIGAVVMPFSVSMEVTDNRWLFGAEWCDLWHSFDVLASTASILNLSVIALDRYWAIVDPIVYPGRMTSGRAFILIALVWICSAAISFPAIAWWRSVLHHPTPDWTCSFTEDSGYLIFSSMVSFYFPVTVILFAYYRIYRAASEQIRSLKRGSKTTTSNGLNGEVMTLRIHRGRRVDGGRTAVPGSAVPVPPPPLEASSCSSDTDNGPLTVSTTAAATAESSFRQLGSGGGGGGGSEPGGRYASVTSTSPSSSFSGRPSRLVSRRWKHFAVSRKLSKVIKEQKAAKTLGIVMGVFCLCWVPFFVTNFLYGACRHLDCVRHAEVLFRVFAWLGYLNSGMNPVIYAASMREFRRAFLKLLCCCCPGDYYYRFAYSHATGHSQSMMAGS